MVLVHKWLFFFLGNISQENVFYDILEQKNAFNAIKTRRSKSGKNDILPKGLTHCFWSKNGHFSNFFLCNIGQENVFYDILERKNAFLGYKNKKFKQSRIWHFSKRINSWFWSKNGHFFNFFFLGNEG